MQIAQPKTRRWTHSEYYSMAELGWFDGQRVELLAGEVVTMPPQRDTHVIGVSLAAKALGIAFGPGFWVRVQAPLNLGRHDDPEPDLVVVVGSERDYLGSDNRVQPLLVVEVSDTTLAYDRGRKARRYARAGIGDYWIVNLPGRRLEVHRDPVLQGRRYRYQNVMPLGEQDLISPLVLPAVKVRVLNLWP